MRNVYGNLGSEGTVGQGRNEGPHFESLIEGLHLRHAWERFHSGDSNRGD